MQITWLTQGSFLFESNGKRIVADPYMSDCLEAKGVKRMVPFPLSLEELRPDVLLCTHDHLDHLDPETVEKIAAAYPNCIMAGSINSYNHFQALGVAKERCVLLKIGEPVTLAGFDLLPVYARHSDKEAVGVVLAADGEKVYLSGDTEFDDRLLAEPATRELDLVLICINGRLGNMNLDDAVKTVKALRPKLALPMHYGLFAENTVEPEPFVRQCREAGIESFAMELGKVFALPGGLAGHAPSLLPPEKKWRLVWHDEFDGKNLDRSKWDFRRHLLQQEHHTFCGEEGVELDGQSNLLLKLIEKDGHYYSPHLQTGSNYMDRPGTGFCFDSAAEKPKMVWPVAKIQEPKFMHKYGYYECRCKLPTQPGWWAAFWLQSPCIGSTLNPAESGVEVDIMENFTRDGVIYHNNHWSGYGADHQSLASGKRQLEETADGFHVFGLDWSPDGYIYYIDGKESWRVKGPVSHREQFILISTECKGYREGNQPSPLLKDAVLPDSFVVDYVRVYDEVKELHS